MEQIDAASDDDEKEDEGENTTCNNKRTQQHRHHDQKSNNTNVTISPRELALARTKHSHPKFASFIDEMMLIAGALQPADNGGGGDGDLISSLLEGHGLLVLAPVPRRSCEVDTNGNAETGSGNSDARSDEDSDDIDSSSNGEGSESA